MPIDAELRAILLKKIGGKEDSYQDNTVEVVLPMVHYFFPKVKIIWLRLPAKIESFESGKIISQIAAELNRNVNVLASADLTHYGANYGFSPQGRGQAALRWVREVNDAAFIKAVESGNSGEVLCCARQNFSSCSAGAVLGVMGFAEEEALASARLLEYSTSADADDSGDVPDSFVGYAAMVFNRNNQVKSV
jgi:hypothetical protein